jgi:DNA-binding LacI/PurR family transcriptional regulator
MRPSLTAIKLGGYQVAAKALEILLQIIRKEAGIPREYLYPPELIIKNSTSPPKN